MKGSMRLPLYLLLFGAIISLMFSCTCQEELPSTSGLATIKLATAKIIAGPPENSIGEAYLSCSPSTCADTQAVASVELLKEGLPGIHDLNISFCNTGQVALKALKAVVSIEDEKFEQGYYETVAINDSISLDIPVNSIGQIPESFAVEVYEFDPVCSNIAPNLIHSETVRVCFEKDTADCKRVIDPLAKPEVRVGGIALTAGDPYFGQHSFASSFDYTSCKPTNCTIKEPVTSVTILRNLEPGLVSATLNFCNTGNVPLKGLKVSMAIDGKTFEQVYESMNLILINGEVFTIPLGYSGELTFPLNGIDTIPDDILVTFTEFDQQKPSCPPTVQFVENIPVCFQVNTDGGGTSGKKNVSVYSTTVASSGLVVPNSTCPSSQELPSNMARFISPKANTPNATITFKVKNTDLADRPIEGLRIEIDLDGSLVVSTTRSMVINKGETADLAIPINALSAVPGSIQIRVQELNCIDCKGFLASPTMSICSGS